MRSAHWSDRVLAKLAGLDINSRAKLYTLSERIYLQRLELPGMRELGLGLKRSPGSSYTAAKVPSQRPHMIVIRHTYHGRRSYLRFFKWFLDLLPRRQVSNVSTNLLCRGTKARDGIGYDQVYFSRALLSG